MFGLNRDYDDREISHGGSETPISKLLLEEDGVYYYVEAVEGQQIVMFDEIMSHKEAVKILKKNQAKIVAQMPDVQYYLVEVPSGIESDFFSSLRNRPGVDYVFPNAIENNCSVTAHVIDNFYGSHGDKVTSMMKGCYPRIDVEFHNVGWDDGKHINTYKVHRDFKKIIGNLGETESAIINMSFGPFLKSEKEQHLWNDSEVTDSERNNYIYSYTRSIEGLVKQVKRFDDKDFVIVHSAGNEGMKDMEVILKSIRESLSSEEYLVFERHFIFVSAKDENKEGDYPNEVRIYNKMVTTVDISDMTAQDLDWQGNSFSSPRAGGFIISIANANDMKVLEVIKYEREATRLHPEHLLVLEKLDSLIVADNNENNELVGTLWQCCNGFPYRKCTMEFLRTGLVRYTERLKSLVDDDTIRIVDYKYFHKGGSDWRIVVNASGNQEPFYIINNVLVLYTFAFGSNRYTTEYYRVR